MRYEGSTVTQWSDCRLADSLLPENPYIVAGGEQLRRYDLLKHPAIVSALAKLEVGSASAAIAFTNAWGFLAPALADGRQSTSGSASWLWGHAESLRVLFSLSDLLGRAADHELKDFLARLPGRHLLRPDELDVLPYFDIATPSGYRLFSASTTSASAIAQEIVNIILAENLSGRRHQWRWQGTRLEQEISYESPIVVVYEHAANAIASGKARRCEYCQGWFVKDDPRQRFCPSSAPWPSNQPSACSSNGRKQRQLSKRRRSKDVKTRKR